MVYYDRRILHGERKGGSDMSTASDRVSQPVEHTAGQSVQILLSTYNGEAYLREQLDSYLALEPALSVRVLIRDDGSTDRTPQILEEYRQRYGFTVILGDNVGLNRSMYALVAARDPSCDYYAFSDQDDVWLPDKLTRAVSALRAEDGPCLYAGSSQITDAALRVQGYTRVPVRPPSFYNAMVENVCIGHTLVVNRALMSLYAAGFSPDIFVFDWWMYLLASSHGRVICEDSRSTLYRQHGDNAIGYRTDRIGVLRTRIRRVLTGKSYYAARQLRAFCQVYAATLPLPLAQEAARFFSSQRHFLSRLCYVCHTPAYRQTCMEGLIFRLMYLFGRYTVPKGDS